eukprot:1165440-Amphidinium_carterae.1
MADRGPENAPITPDRANRRVQRAQEHQRRTAPSPMLIPFPQMASSGEISSSHSSAAWEMDAEYQVLSSTPETPFLSSARRQATSRLPLTSSMSTPLPTGLHELTVEPLASTASMGMGMTSTPAPPLLSQPSVQLEPGVAAITTDRKFRGGAPPAAPTLSLSFAQCAENPLAFRQWQRRVKAWHLRASQWMPAEELALVLLEALHGDSALLCQDIPLA